MRFFCLVTILFISFPALASRLELSALYYYFDYEEFDQNSRSLNNEKGYIPGLHAELTHMPFAFLEASIGFDVSSNTIDYKGFTQLGRSHATDTKAHFNKVFSSLAYVYTYDQLTIKPFIGLNKLKWKREIQANNGVSGLTELYRWDEWVFGCRLNYALSIGELTGSLKAMLVRNGKIGIDLPSISAKRIMLELGDDNGSEFNLGYRYFFATNQSITFNAFYKEWRFSRGTSERVNTSSGVSLITEPRSISSTNGITLNYSYDFN